MLSTKLHNNIYGALEGVDLNDENKVTSILSEAFVRTNNDVSPPAEDLHINLTFRSYVLFVI